MALSLLLHSCALAPLYRSASEPVPEPVVGIHLLSWSSDSLLVELGKVVPSLAETGINLIILEVDYSFDFQSHPELRGGRRITEAGARQFGQLCRANGIRLIPEFQSLGHQSWGSHTLPLLTQYPELDLTPGAFPGNEGIYCREWDPTNPRVNEIVFPMIDEIVAAFDADGIHVGMDEIFLLNSDKAPNAKGKDPAQLFAQVVNEFHTHFVEEQGLEMYMWADRLIDGPGTGYSSYASSHNGTASAVDMIPTDIILCDWHYTPMGSYPSIPVFLDKGFRVLPSSYQQLDAVDALIKYSFGLEHPNMIGHLFTTWRRLTPDSLQTYAPMLTGMETVGSGRYYDVTFELLSVSDQGVLQVALSAPRTDLGIYYTRDGSEPDLGATPYSEPVRLAESALLKAIAYRDGAIAADVTQKQFVVHKATGRRVTLDPPASPKYPTQNGSGTLVNGMTGSRLYADGQWVGLEGQDLEAVIDLGAPAEVSVVALKTLQNRTSWVHHGRGVEVFGSTDGISYGKLGQLADIDTDVPILSHRVAFAATVARYIKVRVQHRIIPEGFDGAGSGAWLFVDEIVVE